ncbi:MAG: hypothetical protein AAF441_28765 [Pseudomonadota bacterium]
MTVEVHILNAKNRLDPGVSDAIRSGIAAAVKMLSEHVRVDGIDIVVQLHEGSIWGRTYGPESLTIYVNPEDPDLKRWTSEQFTHLAMHELHHALRWKSLAIGSFDDWTPGEVLALEGLATRCELFFGLPSYPALEIDDTLIDPLLEKIASDISARYANAGWIDEQCGLPVDGVRAASAMGHLLVGRFLKRTGETPITALQVPWAEIWDKGSVR